MQAQAPIYIDGEYIISTTSPTKQNYLYSNVLVGNSLVGTWNVPLTLNVHSNSLLTTNPISLNNTVAVGSGNYFYILTPGGNTIYQSGDLLSRVLGIAGYGNSYYVQTATTIYSFSTAGKAIFTNNTITDTQNSIPSVGLSSVYTLINGNTFVGYNASTNAYIFNISLPSNYIYGSYSNLALAYGNIYVPSGNVLYTFGTYKPKPNDNILQTLAGMYLSGQGGYANLVLQSLYNSSNLGIFINNTYAPDLSVATFNSATKSYIQQSTGWYWMSNSLQNFSMSVWVNTSSTSGIVVEELPTSTSLIEIANGVAYARVGGMSCVRLGSVPLKKWTDIAFAYNGSSNTLTGYLNGALANTISMTT
jgi:hypothetical protein